LQKLGCDNGSGRLQNSHANAHGHGLEDAARASGVRIVQQKETHRVSTEDSMSMEDAILSLARVISSQQEGTAVREIISQRDEAQKQTKAAQRSEAMYREWYERERKSNAVLGRRVIALRGVITRMKRKAGAR
jgi:hypothetical protein